MGVCVNSTAHLQLDEQGNEEQIGNRTECALLGMAKKFGSDYLQLRKDMNDVRQIPFSSKTKMMSTVVDEKGTNILYCKGAAELVLDRCSNQMDLDGNTKPLGESDKGSIKTEVIEKYANDALRTVAIAYREIQGSLPESDEEV